MKRFACAAVAAAGLVMGLGQASAADLPRAPARVPVVATPVFSWTGFYIGANVGWVGMSSDGTSDFQQPFAPPFAVNPQGHDISDSSFLAGGQIGYNWQFAPAWVLGVEADWQWASPGGSFCRQTDFLSAACVDNGRGFVSVSSDVNWIATARARLGFVWDRYMFYGTGGAAWADVDTTLTALCGVAGCGANAVPNTTAFGFSNTQSGWTAGLGVEAMVTPNWTVKVEWLHIDLGSVTDAFTSTPATGAYTVSWSRDLTFEVVRLGVNYKF